MSLSNLIEQGSLRGDLFRSPVGAAKDFFQSWDLPRRNEEEQAAALTNLEQRVEKFIRAADRFWRQDRLLPLIRVTTLHSPIVAVERVYPGLRPRLVRSDQLVSPQRCTQS